MKAAKKIATVIGAVGALGGLLAGVGALTKGDGATAPGTTVTGTGNTVGNGNISGGNNGCVINASGDNAQISCGQVTPQPIAAGVSDEQAAQSSARPDKPTGSGPWAFNILFEDGDGAWVRNSPEIDGVHIGLAKHGSVVYADCVAESAFNPVPDKKYGPKWMKVHWPTSQPQDTVLTSSPSNPLQGWVWGYYMRPNGTNGEIPACA